MSKSIGHFRKEYTLEKFRKTQAHPNPFEQFTIWYNQAIAAKLPEANGMTLATATSDGKPSARIVLLKAYNEQGFVFYTNYQSQKGQQLAANPWGAIVFWWSQLERQVRIEGKIEKVSAQESDEYFQTRPQESQLGAWVSEQSQIIESREILDQRLQQLKKDYEHKTIPRPPDWGGFRLIPVSIEFWQGRPSRLHDRLLYQRNEDNNWVIQRLSP